jgi:hypothetical protein
MSRLLCLRGTDEEYCSVGKELPSLPDIIRTSDRVLFVSLSYKTHLMFFSSGSQAPSRLASSF